MLDLQETFIKPAQEVLQKFKEVKHKLLEVNEWKSSIEKDHPEKKKIQKEYREALSTLNQKVKDHDHINENY